MQDRRIPPPFVQSTSYDLIKPEKVLLSNGANLYFIRGGEQEIIKLELVFSAGRWFEPSRGISYFTSNLISKGTRTKNSQQIAERLDSMGVHLEVTPGFDFVSVSMYGLLKNIPCVLDLLIEIITQPSFPEEEIGRAKTIYIQNLRINLEKTDYLSSLYFRQNLFGNSHPYGGDAGEDQVKSIQAADFGAFHKKHFTGSTGFISGKVTDAMSQLLQEKLSHLPFYKTENDLTFKSLSRPDQSSFFKEKAGSVQASLRLGKKVISRTHPDYPHLLLVNHILGGFFGSRLMKNIREEKGLTYGVYSSVHSLKNESYFVIGADVNRENRDLTVREIKNELRRLRTELISLEELEIARNHFIGSLQSEISTPLAHADKIKNIVLFNLHESYYQKLIDEMVRSRPEILMHVAQTYLHEDEQLVVAVG